MRATTFLMFQGRAEEAIRYYQQAFPELRVVSMDKFQAGEPGKPGSVKQAQLELAGLSLRCFDSPVTHAFSFTPAISLFIDCDDEAQLDRIYEHLARGGKALMEPANYGFSRKFTWVEDQFGVSWQLNLP